MTPSTREPASELISELYRELRALARARLARLPPGQTLAPTALVHEAVIRLLERGGRAWDGRGHLFAAAARAMREVLVDEARRKAAIKRGGDRRRVPLSESEAAVLPPGDDVLALDEALRALAEESPRRAQVAEMRAFGGFTTREAAEALGLSVGTVERDWSYAKAWLASRLHRDEEP